MQLHRRRVLAASIPWAMMTTAVLYRRIFYAQAPLP
jgi:hypothetical protein